MIKELANNLNSNEPTVHPLVKKSFAFLPSTGMRHAPEILVLEFMREVFFKPHYGIPNKTVELTVGGNDDIQYVENELAVLMALRSRRKSKNAKASYFFAPAYPQLARNGWLGAKRERVIKNFLFSGPLAQGLWYKGETCQNGIEKQKILIEEIIDAAIGKKSNFQNGFEGVDLFAALLAPLDMSIYKNQANDNLKILLSPDGWVPMDFIDDPISSLITNDFLAICKLEGDLPRMQWIQIIMTFLRFSLPMWILSQMKITTILHKWLIDAMDKETLPSHEEIENELKGRFRGLLHPTQTPTRELYEHTERYMKCRVELNILLYVLEEVNKSKFENKVLKVHAGSADVIGIEELLIFAKTNLDKVKRLDYFNEIARDLDIKRFLIRSSEQYAAWRNPLSKGQGKNIDEFFRVLYRVDEGDEQGGYLLAPEGRGQKRGFRIFPGQLLLKTITYLASKKKQENASCGGAGRLILKDVEDHFASYGIDFSIAADARPLLMKELQSMGLLVGSPDAGASVNVYCPF